MTHGELVLDITVPGDPQPKERPRVAGNRGRTPAATRAAENGIRTVAMFAMRRREPVTGDVAVELVFRRSDGIRVDIDNLVKLALDALNKTVWRDDAQVVHLTARLHRYTRPAGLDMRVWLLEPASAA